MHVLSLGFMSIMGKNIINAYLGGESGVQITSPHSSGMIDVF